MDKRRFWPDYCGFLSLVISVAMIVLWICGVWELKVVNLNTFIGVIVSLLAIIVTLVIAWQIYNALELKNKVEELKQLEVKLEDQKKSLEQFKNETIGSLFGVLMLIKRDQKNYVTAFNCSLYALDAIMQLEESVQFDDILDVMDSINKDMGNTKTKTKEYNEIVEIDKELRSRPNYHFIKRRYEPIYKEFMSKVEKAEE